MKRNPAAVPDVCVSADPGGCSVCADEGLIGEVLEVAAEHGAAARVRIGGSVREVAVDLLEGVRAGDRVVVHLGFAIARVEDR